MNNNVYLRFILFLLGLNTRVNNAMIALQQDYTALVLATFFSDEN